MTSTRNHYSNHLRIVGKYISLSIVPGSGVAVGDTPGSGVLVAVGVSVPVGVGVGVSVAVAEGTPGATMDVLNADALPAPSITTAVRLTACQMPGTVRLKLPSAAAMVWPSKNWPWAEASAKISTIVFGLVCP